MSAGLDVPAAGTVPALVTALCDDAAVFPPGLAFLPDAVRAHQDRRGRWYAALVGPLVVAESAVSQLGPLVAPGAALRLSVTLPGGPAGLAAVVAACAALPVTLDAVEVVVPDAMAPAEFFDRLAEAVADTGVAVHVEVPRDERRAAVVEGLAGRYRAKFRTGGVRADLHPDAAELAAGVAAVVAAGVPFKATAGLHHAVRNTDPATGAEQHGFLNLLLATEHLTMGGSEAEARTLLEERDGAAVVARLRALDEDDVRRTRAAFTSFGTCSVLEPLDDLIELGIVEVRPQEGAGS